VALVLLFVIVTAGQLPDLVFRRMSFCLEATQDLGLNHLLNLFQLFSWRMIFLFLTHNIKTARIYSHITLDGRQEPLGRRNLF